MQKQLSNNRNIFLLIITLFVASVFYFELRPKNKAGNEATITFWQYWNGTEKEPIKKLVEKFNEENHGFKVDMLTISMPRKKILMAITAGVAPDLVHLDGEMVADFALRNALTNLDPYFNKKDKNRFIDVYVKMLNIKNKQWAMPLMPSCEAMHINTGLLGKNKIPKTLDDLVKLFNETTDFENFERIAWLPSWPPWVARFIPSVFGGKWGELNQDGSFTITANSPENIEAWTWVQDNFARKIPRHRLQAFTEGFSAYQSPDNPFYTGRIAIENNGVWEKHLAKKFAPKLDIKAVAFPTKAGITNASMVTVDALAIPRGAKNTKLAIKFMNWLSKEENLEYLAQSQHKFSPLKNISEDFISTHANPYIATFIDLAKSPNAIYFPQIALVEKYRREIKRAYSEVLRLEKSPKDALDEIQEIMEKSLAKI